MPKLELDHLVVAATSLKEGRLFVREHLGLEMQPGGRHDRMGTHNCLLRIGTKSYLEVIAVDPDGIKPRLLHWVARVTTGDLEEVCLPKHGAVHAMTRGSFSWRITIRHESRVKNKTSVRNLNYNYKPTPSVCRPHL
jgi:Glyoxalase-like domain